ncbi:threonine ammonia-lyase [bacterium]|nr:threonine ammonia-lyase [bacterium]
MRRRTRGNMISITQIEQANRKVREIVNPTPVKRSYFLEDLAKCKVHLKLESLNLSGSFKIRGAANALLSAPRARLEKGVIAASAGNHAQGVAQICKRIGVRSTIFMPARTPLVKAQSTKALGATINLSGDSYDAAYAAARQFQAQTGGEFVHAFDDPRIIAGQGTVALELFEQVPDATTIIVPIGGGGLISGIACAYKSRFPHVKVIGVQTEAYPAVARSLEAGTITPTAYHRTIADGIAVKQPSELTFEMIKKYVDQVVLVSEDEIADALMALMEHDHVLAEGCGAVTVAALAKLSHTGMLSREMPSGTTPSVVCIVSGGNIDTTLLQRITTRGLLRSGRFMRLHCTIEDRPGKLVEFLNILSNEGANLVEVEHNRMFGMSYYDEVRVDVDLETTGRDQQEKILAALHTAGFKATPVL